MNAPNTKENMKEQLAEKRPSPVVATNRRWWLLGAVAAVALALGAVGGWIAASDAEPTAMVAGGGELTERQDQMAAVLDDFTQAWHAGDGAEVTGFFAPSGTATYLGTEYLVSDGSLAQFVESASWESLDILEPSLIDGNKVAFFHRYRGLPYMDVIEFTASGELLIASHTIAS